MNFNPLPVILSIVGVYFLFKLRFFFILHPFRTAKKTFNAVKDKRTLKSLTLALAGTLGVGNVLGVALGLIIGGAGSLFWLLISMIFACVIKYAEVVISSDNLFHDTDSHGGMYYVIGSSFKKCGRLLSSVYAVSAVLVSLLLGAALQCGTVRETVSEIGSIPRITVAVVLSLLVIFSIFGGAKKIEKITAIVIPMTTIIYIITTFTIITVNYSAIPNAISLIISSAFRVDSAVGGVLGFLVGAPLHEGFARGILSNEAGAGTSSMAYARSGVLNPASAGLLGIFEVWFDTGLICMLTGLSVLVSVPDFSRFRSGMSLIMHSVGTLYGNVGRYAILLSVFAFAFATVICWYYYGMESFSALFGRKRRILFMPLFVVFVFVGTMSDSLTLVSIIDILMAVLTFLTVIALIKNSDRIKALSERGGIIDRNYKIKLKGSVSRRERGDRAP